MGGWVWGCVWVVVAVVVVAVCVYEGEWGGWGAEQGLSLQTPVIVKYRDEKTDLATALEAWLR
jgi:hypothetical protein